MREYQFGIYYGLVKQQEEAESMEERKDEQQINCDDEAIIMKKFDLREEWISDMKVLD